MLSVGIVGAGEIVSRIHLPVLSACEGIRSRTLRTKILKRAARRRSYKVTAITVEDNLAMLPQTDVVLLAVPVTARLPYYELFAKRGTSVLSEKPFAVVSFEAERMCGMYPEYSFACGFQRRSYASVVLARLLVAGTGLVRCVRFLFRRVR